MTENSYGYIEFNLGDDTHVQFHPGTGRLDVTTASGGCLVSRVWWDEVPRGHNWLPAGMKTYSECRGSLLGEGRKDPENGMYWGTPFGLGAWSFTDHITAPAEWPLVPVAVAAALDAAGHTLPGWLSAR